MKTSKPFLLLLFFIPPTIAGIDTELSNAYAAFQSGDNKAAQKAYNNVLQQDQNNRDALLGLAALALRGGDRHRAQQYYQSLLQKYPQDTLAQVCLINTLDQHAPASETQLKLILAQTPQSAYIHFSLGTLYAKQGRWAAAQQAFLNALAFDKKQADYAYNLAVSSDHLNQSRLALTYYQQALQLAQNQPVVNFNPQAVQKRVQTLNAFISSE
ncbi:TPR repeat-containing protein [Candidatus Thiomargarita nelsonii]|uniref:TPR repeat-containing protein n=1 Tax=Candidatus Thiomargarita nelsonii TaxID=1003181 RepID=A0A176RYX2_9GAMM|nr:TPR repeat-containing protein [Candidatus Thiomargarita nelsonii]